MLRGLYAAASGLLTGQALASVAEGNLMNAGTPGYRTEDAIVAPFGNRFYEAFGPAGGLPLGSTVPSGSMVTGTAFLQTEGPLDVTGRPLDVAIEGPGAFAVATPNGIRYTRDGAFQVDANGELTDLAGDRVLSSTGQPITGLDGQAVILPDGRVLDHGRLAGVLAVYRLGQITAEDQNLLQAVGVRPLNNVTLQPGALELANVSEETNLADILAAAAAYQQAASALSVDNTTLDVLVNQVGRVG